MTLGEIAGYAAIWGATIFLAAPIMWLRGRMRGRAPWERPAAERKQRTSRAMFLVGGVMTVTGLLGLAVAAVVS